MNKIISEFYIKGNNTVQTGNIINKYKLKNSTIAIDINNVIMDLFYKRLHSKCKLSDIDSVFIKDFSNFLEYMLSVDIKILMVFDGGYHKLKQNKWERNLSNESKRINEYHYYKKKINDFIKNNVFDKSILNAIVTGTFYDTSKNYDIYRIDYDIMKNDLYDVLKKTKLMAYRSNYLYDKKIVIDILNKYNITYVTAKYEAENYISALVKAGICDYSLSNDSDMFPYLCPKILRKMDYYSPNLECQLYEPHILINSLKFTNKQFIDLCICLGTDYNNGLDLPYRTIFDLIKQYKSPLSFENVDISCLNYHSVYSIFTDIQIINKITITNPIKTNNIYKLDDCIDINVKIFSVKQGKKISTFMNIDYYYDVSNNVCIFINNSKDLESKNYLWRLNKNMLVCKVY